MEMYDKKILENIRKVEAIRASQNLKDLENTVKESQDKIIAKIREYGSIVYEGD